MTRLIQRFLLIWLSLLSLAAYYWPRFGIPLDPFEHMAEILAYLIIVTMFGVGWMLPLNEIKNVASQWPKIIGGTLTQFLVMPILALGIGIGCGLSGDHLVGVILVGCVPGAMASNVLTIVSKGNASYSVSLTTLATIVSPVAVPAMLAISATLVDESTRKVIESAGSESGNVYLGSGFRLLKWVVLPVVAGFTMGRLLPRYEATAKIVGSNVANLAILLIVATVVGDKRNELAQLTPIIFGCLLLLNFLGYLGGFSGGSLMKLPQPMKRALTLEVGMQNAGLGAVLAKDLFDKVDKERLTEAIAPAIENAGSAVAIAPVFYTFFCMFTGTILAWYWSSKPVLGAEPHKVSQHEHD